MKSPATILCDPQTSGGLLAAVDPAAAEEVVRLMEANGLGEHLRPIGTLKAPGPGARVTVSAPLVA